ncbi:hypothetical protein ACXR0O_19770 [Verrucomicrobiota bacterium sgz303538]
MTDARRKQRLLTEKVRRFLRSDTPVARGLRELAAGEWRTYLFGGTVREILLKIDNPQIRDLDVVIDDDGFAKFRQVFEARTIGVNRFGGLRLILDRIPVDAWSLSSTWAFQTGHVPHAFRHRLPETTFLNIDSVVFEITPGRVRKRLIAEPFLEALENNVMDIVLPENPHPGLAAVRTIRMHLRYDMPMSRRLAQYILEYLESAGVDGCLDEQLRHYHRVVVDREELQALCASLREFMNSTHEKTLSRREQMRLFEELDRP